MYLSLFDYIISFIASFICVLIICKIYAIIYNKQEKLFTLKNIIVFVLISILFIFITFNYYNVFRLLINCGLLTMVNLYVYKDRFSVTIIRTLIIYILEMCIELIFSFLLILLTINDIKVFDNENLLLKNLITILIMLVEILIVNIKKIKTTLIYLINSILKKDYIVIKIILILIYIFMIGLTISFIFNISSENYFTNFIFIAIISIIIYAAVINYNKRVQAEEKEKNLLEFITKYENLLNKVRVNRHEMLNNLIILNSFQNKNSEEFHKVLANLIKDYSIENYELKNIEHLPIGLKGIIYYKMNIIEFYKINFIFYCTKFLQEDLSNKKDYTKFCKMLGIFLDNAIEAASESNDKQLIIDIYYEKKDLVIYIDNTIKNAVKLEEIKKINYSTKGKNRGLGLYIANKLKGQTKYIKYFQKVKRNHFITELRLKIK